MPPPPPALRLEAITKSFASTHAVRGVDFTLERGEVHALLGENGAGKSTLMRVISGSFADYGGAIEVEGCPIELHSPAQARAAGIAMIYQELSAVREVSVAENILAGRLPRKAGWLVDWARTVAEARHWLAEVGLECDPTVLVDSLSQHEIQRVEIAKALSGRPRILIMDEPTSALSRAEVEALFKLIARLKAQGLAIVYVSHHLSEIFAVADRCTVLRDGRRVATRPTRELTAGLLVELMIGRPAAPLAAPPGRPTAAPRLRVERLSRRGFFHEISLEIRAGEVLGLAGLAGSGRSELGRSLCGVDPVDSGRVNLDDVRFAPRNRCEAIRLGFGYVTEDRKREGLALLNSAFDNLMAVADATRRLPVRGPAAFGVFGRIARVLQLAPLDPHRPAGQFSGGNQQKILLGKWLAAELQVLVLDEPTRGVDVGAKSVIHEAIVRLAATGICILLISSDLPELVALSSRAVVMRKGRLVAELVGADLTENAILLAASAAA